MGDSQSDGTQFYLSATRDQKLWADHQLKSWPHRIHPDRTTNISFFYGVVLAVRELTGNEPVMSKEFAQHVSYLDGAKP